MRIWRDKFAADPHWYPGKVDEEAEAPGRKKVITSQQERAIASSMMSAKEKGLVPSVSLAIVRCPKATLNPETGEPFSKKVILQVFRTLCYDNDPDHPWSYEHPKQKTALSPENIEARISWVDVMLAMNHQAVWYYRHIIWMDPCHTIVPGLGTEQFNRACRAKTR